MADTEAVERCPWCASKPVARAIANAMDVDPDVFSGMHGRRLWEKQWLPIAEAAIDSQIG